VQDPSPRDPLGSGQPQQPRAGPRPGRRPPTRYGSACHGSPGHGSPVTAPPAAAPPTAAPTPPAASPTAPGAAPTTEIRRDRQGRQDDRFSSGITTQENTTVRIDDLRRERRERVEEGGRRIIIEEPGNRRIVRENDRVIILHDETQRLRRTYQNAEVRVERRGTEEVTIMRRPNGVEIVTVHDEDGNLVRRVRRDPGGREVISSRTRSAASARAG
jgi:hypothetical protein